MTTPSTGSRTFTSDVPVTVQGIPAGLCAYPVYRERHRDGARIGMPRLIALHVRPPRQPPTEIVTQALESLSEPERRFILKEPTRRSATISRRYSSLNAMGPLVRAGLMTLTTAPPAPDQTVGSVTGWELTAAAQGFAARLLECATEKRAGLQEKAQETALRIKAEVPEAKPLADALEQPRDTGRLDLYVAAAQALLKNERYLGTRDFSSRLRGDTKAVDADRALEDIGVSKAIRERIGVLRYPELSISGPVTISRGTGQLAMHGMGVLVSVPFTAVPMRVTAQADLVVVENKEAAAYLARELPNHVIVWSSGFSGTELHQALRGLSSTCERAWVVCDADTDGVYIANLIAACVPHSVIVDVGTLPGAHARRQREYAGSRTLRGIINAPATAAQVRLFAEQVEARGYDVEQEELMPHVLSLITMA